MLHYDINILYMMLLYYMYKCPSIVKLSIIIIKLLYAAYHNLIIIILNFTIDEHLYI